MIAKARKLAERYKKKQKKLNITFKANAYLHPDFPVIVADSDVIEEYKWGLIPQWVHTRQQAVEIAKRTINARAETIFEKPSFRNAIIRRRCLIPSTGFFEWRHEDTIKQPYFIKLKSEDIFSLAGVYDEWINPDTGKKEHTFSIITTGANPLMAYIHNSKMRMPVIIPRDKEDMWLFPSLSKVEIQSLLQPYPTNDMEAYPVTRDLLKLAPDNPQNIEPIGEILDGANF